MNRQAFLARIFRQLVSPQFEWWEHESAAWTETQGGWRQGEGPDFSHGCKVTTARVGPKFLSFVPKDLDVSNQRWLWWRWKVTCKSGGVKYRASGYAESMWLGKLACEDAVRAIAEGVFTVAEKKEREKAS